MPPAAASSGRALPFGCPLPPLAQGSVAFMRVRLVIKALKVKAFMQDYHGIHA
jgi:hypothetical protein